LRPIFGWLEKVVPISGDLTPGTLPHPLSIQAGANRISVGVLICYEDIFPSLARTSAQSGADVLAVLTNNAWFGEGGAAYQHAAHSVLRAIETRRPVLRCGNGGWSGWIDEFGYVRTKLVDDRDSIYFRGYDTKTISRDAHWIGRQSYYTTHGDWLIVPMAVLLVGAFYSCATIQLKPLPMRRTPGSDPVWFKPD
jgi:apolipoprotein N-acyltransferase